MYRLESVDALDLDDDGVLNQKIEPIVAHSPASVGNGASELSLKLQPLVGQFDAESAIVGAFEQARTESLVHSMAQPMIRAVNELKCSGMGSGVIPVGP